MINKSLTCLSLVINDLAQKNNEMDISTFKGKRPPIPKFVRYRDSKLTYLLKDSLGGNSKTVMICNINPHIMAISETRSTITFAKSVKKVQNCAVINEEQDYGAEYWKEKYRSLEKVTENAAYHALLLSQSVDD